MKPSTLLVLATLAAASTPALAVFKCVGPGGKVSLQDTPCAAAETGTRVPAAIASPSFPKSPAPPEAAASAPAPAGQAAGGGAVATPAAPPAPAQPASPYAKDIARFKEQDKERDRAANAESAIHQKKVILGMREDEVARALGQPRGQARLPDGAVEWHYPGQVILFENGAVTAWRQGRR